MNFYSLNTYNQLIIMNTIPADIILNIMEFTFEKIHYIRILKTIGNKSSNQLIAIMQNYLKYLEDKHTITIFYKHADDIRYDAEQKLTIYYRFIDHKTLNKVKKYCNISTFGNSTSKQNVDKNIRNSYVITCNNFKITKNLIQKFKPQIIDYLKDKFKYKGIIDFEKHSLNLYTTNSHFHEHIDESNCKNYIGTLVLLLPTKFTGGELLINKELCKWKKLYNTNISWVFINKHTLHSVNKITSGFRITILYDVTCSNNHYGGFSSGGVFNLISRQGKQDSLPNENQSQLLDRLSQIRYQRQNSLL